MTKSTPMEQFSILKTAGVGPSFFAGYFGFGRVSVSMWVNGRAEPHPLHRSAVLAALEKVKKAYDGGRLPLTGKLTKADKVSALRKALEDPSAD